MEPEMFALKDLSDRYEIEQLVRRYCHAIDTRDFDALDDIFSADAAIDYTAAGGAKGDLAEAKAYLARALARFPKMQHIAANTILQVSGDEATGRTMLFNPMVIEKDGREHVFYVSATYDDVFARTPDGWRIASRKEENVFFQSMPSWMAGDE